MMEALGKWLLSVSATALAVSVLQTLIPEGGIRRVATFIGGLLLLAVLLRPVLGADFSSLTVGLTMLKNGEGDAFVSAGSTGALLAGATLLVKRIRGVRRAAMGPVLPTATGRALLCDCGANADCTPEYLLQFA